MLNGSPWWLPVLFAVGGVALTVLASLLGPSLLQRDVAMKRDGPDWFPITQAQIVRKVATVAVTFGVFLVVGVTAIVITFITSGKPSDVGSGIALGAALAFIAGGCACLFVSLPLNRLLRESTDRNPTLLRKISKVVLRGKTVDLNHGERIAAAKYAHIVTITLPFQLAYVAMLYAGLAINQVQQLSTDMGLFSIVFLIGLVVVLIWFFPLTIFRIRRAHRYALANDGLLTHPAAAASSSAGLSSATEA